MNAVALSQLPPSGLSQRQINAQLNNKLAMAMASADPRFAVKQYDRPGLSRAGGAWNQAGIDAAKNLSEGISAAYSQQADSRGFNANTQLQGQQAQEEYGQALAGLQAQTNYANQMAALQRQQAAMGILGNLLGGLFD